MEVPPLSQSKQGLMACPYLYRDRVINGMEEAENPYAQRGIEIHDVTAKYVEHLVETRQASDPEYFETLMQAGIGAESYEILRTLRNSLTIDPERVLGVEMYLALDSKLKPIEMPDEPRKSGHRSERGADFEGTLDYVQLVSETEAEIFDWKSYFQVIEADTFQAHLYPVLLFKHYPFLERVRFVLQFVRYGISRDVVFTREQLPELEAMVLTERRRQLRLHKAAEGAELAGDDAELAWEMGENRLGAMPGNHCAWCPKMSASIRAEFISQTTGIPAAANQGQVCPIASINPFVQQTPEDRLRYAVFMDQCRKENANILREFVTAGGPVTITDANGQTYTAGYEPTVSEKFPAQDAVELLIRWMKETGEDLLSKVFVGSTELKPLLKAKKRAALSELMGAVTVSITKTKWHIGKSDEEEDGE
jgi:hypothetical protein